MRGHIIRKILGVLIIFTPAFSYSGCKKQAKCGCDGDILYALTKEQATVYYNESGTSIQFSTLTDPYSQYYFCNPGEMFKIFTDNKYKTGDVLQVTGDVFWDCTYLSQSSNGSYQSYYKVYQIMVTDVTVDLYGKK
ncbi:MAG: hypothetical protein NT144_06985 [Bacteroidia bacterium]|nr:hypothetical protein [Bacteroidia bacterium]